MNPNSSNAFVGIRSELHGRRVTNSPTIRCAKCSVSRAKPSKSWPKRYRRGCRLRDSSRPRSLAWARNSTDKPANTRPALGRTSGPVEAAGCRASVRIALKCGGYLSLAERLALGEHFLVVMSKELSTTNCAADTLHRLHGRQTDTTKWSGRARIASAAASGQLTPFRGSSSVTDRTRYASGSRHGGPTPRSSALAASRRRRRI